MTSKKKAADKPKKTTAKRSTSKKAIAVRAFATLTEHELFVGDISRLTDEEVAGIWSAMDLMEKISKNRKAEIREYLFDRLEDIGVEN